MTDREITRHTHQRLGAASSTSSESAGRPARSRSAGGSVAKREEVEQLARIFTIFHVVFTIVTSIRWIVTKLRRNAVERERALGSGHRGIDRQMQILQHLRQATRVSHDAFEDGYDIQERLGCVWGRRKVIAGLHSVYAPAEEALATLLEPIPGLRFAARCKSPRLAADLLQLGFTRAELTTLPREPMPTFGGTVFALGFAYVLEGATLGGVMIRKRLMASGHSLAGLSFYNCYGAAVGQHWKEFCAILEDVCVGQADETVEGAREGFRAVSSALKRSLSVSVGPLPEPV